MYDEPFQRHLAEHAGTGDSAIALEGLHLGDLYLAYACAVGNRRAIDLLEATHLSAIDRAFTRTRAKGWTDDVRQLLRHKLLVAEHARRPAIAEYSGKGALRNWLRVTATRVLLSAARGRRAHPTSADGDDATLLEIPTAAPDAEVAYLQEHYGAAFRASVADAARSLSVADRAMLRYALVEKLDADGIAAIYGIHRTTAGRRLSTARANLIKRVREDLKERLRISDRELTSIMNVVSGNVEVTFERILAEEG